MRARMKALLLRGAAASGALVRTLPGVLGATAICVGLGLIYTPLALLAAGTFLLIIDRRVP